MSESLSAKSEVIVRNAGERKQSAARENPGRQFDAAMKDRSNGIYSIPVRYQTKKPTSNGWSKLRLEEEGLRAAFSDPLMNRSRLLGEVSGGIVDCDLDCEEAVRLAPAFLPSTGDVHGRPGNPNSHYWYRVEEGGFKTLKFQDESGEMLVELSGDGALTVVPPSVHESGEPVFWSKQDGPLQIAGATLAGACSRLAAAAMLLRHYPSRGGRHSFVLAVAGLLLQGGLAAEAAGDLVRAVADAAGDEEAESRVRDVESTAQRLERNEPVQGRSELLKLLGSRANKIVRKLEEWLGLQRPFTAAGISVRDPAEYHEQFQQLLEEARSQPKEIVAKWLTDGSQLEELAEASLACVAGYQAWLLQLRSGGVPAVAVNRLEAAVTWGTARQSS